MKTRDRFSQFYIASLFLTLLLISAPSAHAISWTAMPDLGDGNYHSTAAADFNNDGYKDIVGASDAGIGAWQQYLRWVCGASVYSWSFNQSNMAPNFSTDSKAVAAVDIGSGPGNSPNLKGDGYPDLLVASAGGLYVFYGNGKGSWNSTPPAAGNNIGYGKMTGVYTDPATTPADTWTVSLNTAAVFLHNLPTTAPLCTGNTLCDTDGDLFLDTDNLNDGDIYEFTFKSATEFTVKKNGIYQGEGTRSSTFITFDGAIKTESGDWSGTFADKNVISVVIDMTPATLSVTGASAGTLPDAEVGVAYSDSGIAFRVDEGEVRFAEGDYFTFDTYDHNDNQISSDGDIVALDVKDVDHDGELEIIAGTTNGIRVYDFTGGLWTVDSLTLTLEWRDLVVKDINRDGNLDIVSASSDPGGSVIKAWYGDVTGNWTPNDLTTSSAVYYSLAVDDINGDGNLDILAGVGNNGIEVWFGKSDGSFAKDATKPVPTGTDRYYDLKLYDINYDGRLDLIGGQWGGGILVWLGDGSGNWIPETTPVVIGDYRDLSLEDFNNDGLIDVAGANFGGGVDIFLQVRDSAVDVGWRQSEFPASSGDFQGVAPGDFNRDGNADAVIAGNASGVRVFYGDGRRNMKASLSVYKGFSGTGNGTISDITTDDLKTITENWTVTCITGGASPVFSVTRSSVGTPESAQYALPGTYINAATGVSFVIYQGSTSFAAGDKFTFRTVKGGIKNTGIYYGVLTADFNSDGILDIAAASNGGTGIDVWYGNGEGEWDSVPPPPIGAWDGDSDSENIGSGNYYYLTAEDINQDGKTDIVAGSDSGVQIFLNTWNGTITGWNHTVNNDPATTGSYAGVGAADFNNDGKMDIAAANKGGSGVKVWLGKGDGSFRKLYASKPIKDWDGDYVEDSVDSGTGNTGNGWISDITVDDSAPSLSESSWYAKATAPNFFDVYKDGANIDTVAVPGTYTNATYGIAFTITAGTTPFAANDRFSFKTYKDTGPVFKSGVVYPDGSILSHYYDGLAVADFNRDGNPDIAAGNLGNFGVQVFYGDGDGGRHGHVSWTLSMSTPPVNDCANAGDIYIQDLASLPYWSRKWSTYRWQGSFLKEVNVGGRTLELGVTTLDYVTPTADIELTANEPSAEKPWHFTVSVAPVAAYIETPYFGFNFDFILRGTYYSYKDPVDKLYFTSYRPGTTDSGQYYGVAAADINQDGYPDVVAANKNNGGVQVWLNSGRDAFYRTPVSSAEISEIWTAASSPIQTGNYNGVAVVDFNKDGKLDVLSAHDFTSGTGAEVWLNTVDFVPPTVSSHTPAANATGVSTTAPITAAFSEDIDILTLKNKDTDGQSTSAESTVIAYGTQTGYHSGVVLYDQPTATMTFIPDTPFKSSEIVTVTLSSRITDLSGNYLDGNGDGESLGDPSDNSSWTFTVKDTVKPLPPTALVGTKGEGKALLSWTAPVMNEDGSALDDLAGFDVYRSTEPGGLNYQKVNSSIVSAGTYTYTDLPLSNGITYYYVVTAVDASGNKSTNSNQASVTPAIDTVAPNPPTGLAATPGDGRVDLTWTAPTNNTDGSLLMDLSGYDVYRDTASGGPYSGPINNTMIPAGTINYTDSTVTNGTPYYYVVRAIDSSVNKNTSSNSNQASATPATDNVAPKAPTSLTATGGDSIITLTWVAPTQNDNGSAPISDFGSYKIYRHTAPFINITDTGVSPVATISAYSTTTWQDTTSNGLIIDATHYYRIVSTDIKGNVSTAPSNQASAVPANPVGAITLSADKYTIPADGVAESVITAYVQSPLGYPALDNTAINFAVSCVFTNCGILSVTSAMTTGGIATVKLTASTTFTDQVTVTASSGTVSASSTIAFKPGPPASIELSASPTTIYANGTDTTTITAVVKDEAGNSIKDGMLVTMRTTLGTFPNNTMVSDPLMTSGGNGTVSVVLTAGVAAGTPTITAQIGALVKTYTGLTLNADVTAPAVTSVTPTSGATGVYVNSNISAVFNEAIKGTTLTASTVTASGSKSGLITGSISYNFTTRTVTFDPSSDLKDSETVTVTLTTGITDMAGNPLASNYVWNFTTRESVAPSAPSGLAAAAGNAQVSLTWTANPEADLNGYNVYRSETSGSGYAKVNLAGSITGTTYTDTGVTNGTTYYYVITAVDTTGNESGYSSEASATPSSDTPPSPPSGLQAVVGGMTSINLAWTANTESDLSGYKIYQSSTSGSGYTLIATLGKVTSYQAAGLTTGTTYYFVMTATDVSSYESSYSAEASSRPGLIGDVDGVLVGGRLTVDGNDLILLGASFGSSKGEVNYNPYADLNGDGVIDFRDMVTLGMNFGRTS